MPKKIESVDDLTPDAKNANKHSQRGMALMENSIRECGYGDSITVDREGRIISGNARTEVLADIKMLDPIVVQSDGTRPIIHQRTDLDLETDPRAKRLGIYQNRVGEVNLEWDVEVLAQFKDEGVDLSGLWNDDELEELLESGGGGGIIGDPDEIPENVETRCKYGDLWLLGSHRLLCGDSTKAEDVGRLLDGAVPFLCVTDPPYGVDYDPNWRNEADRANGKPYGARAVGLVTNDDRADWRKTWELFPGDVIYSWHPPGATSLIHARALQDSEFELRMQIIWAKNQFPIGRGDYHVKHEPCWYAIRTGKVSKRTDDRSQHTLWEIDKPHKSDTGHSTQKPVECMAMPIRNHERCEVYDPFLGSGTTMIAAEQLGRKCYGIEIEPKYADICLARWEAATGRQAELVEHGRLG